MARAYLDHASTTPPRPEALAALTRWATLGRGDPGRVHQEGRTVRAALEDGTRAGGRLLGVAGRQVVFTSGGTEAVNAAVWGATRAAPGAPGAVRRGRALGRPRRLDAARARPSDSPSTARAGSSVDALAERLRATAVPRPALVHCQWANHEVGTLQPVAEVVALLPRGGRRRSTSTRPPPAATCPATSATLGADLVSVSAHKLGGVPGAGALVVRRGPRVEPLLVGGEQERGRRAGLEAVPALLAFGAAAAALAAEERTGPGHARQPSARGQIAGRRRRRPRRRWASRWSGRARRRSAPPPGLPRRARRRGRAGAHRPRPGRGGRPLRLGLLVGEHRALARARGHGRRPQPLAAGQRGLDDLGRPTAPPSPPPSPSSSASCARYGAEVVVVVAGRCRRERGRQRPPGRLVGGGDQRGHLRSSAAGRAVGQEVVELRHRGGIVVVLVLEDQPVEEVGLVVGRVRP